MATDVQQVGNMVEFQQDGRVFFLRTDVSSDAAADIDVALTDGASVRLSVSHSLWGHFCGFWGVSCVPLVTFVCLCTYIFFAALKVAVFLRSLRLSAPLALSRLYLSLSPCRRSTTEGCLLSPPPPCRCGEA